LALKKEDLNLLKDIKLDKKILDKIVKAINKRESCVLDFFI
jgi:hypothetical protein